MNLELIKISEDIGRHLDTFKFETIWPFVLYLFNYWVKNQANLMMQTQTHPQRQVYQAELKKIQHTRDFIQYFHETPQFNEQLAKAGEADDIQMQVD